LAFGLISTAAHFLVSTVFDSFLADPCNQPSQVEPLSRAFPVLPLFFVALPFCLWSLCLSCIFLTPAPEPQESANDPLPQHSGIPEVIGVAGNNLVDRDNENGEKLPSSGRSGESIWKSRLWRLLQIVAGMAMAAAVLALYLYQDAYAHQEESWDARWGFLQGSGDPLPADAQERPDVAPVWLGEFGTNKNNKYWRHVMRYMKERTVAGWAYWSLNGEKRTNKGESYGLLMKDMKTPRHPWLSEDLEELAAWKFAKYARP